MSWLRKLFGFKKSKIALNTEDRIRFALREVFKVFGPITEEQFEELYVMILVADTCVSPRGAEVLNAFCKKHNIQRLPKYTK